ncbi:hypothetical protein FRC07_000242 [Ceratobasidium sp. 392]|nr:hypothetical protein FRC07_000242 [Ceratobasidium sp. 392]
MGELHWWTTLSTASAPNASPTDVVFSSTFTSYPGNGQTGSFTSAFPAATAGPSVFPGILASRSSALTSAPASLTTTIASTLIFPATTLVTTTLSQIPNPAQTPSVVAADPICAGQGVDAAGAGVIASLVFTAAVGLLIWLLFAILRPKVRALYAAREWFVRPELRPEPLRSTLWAFLFPPVPLVPALSSQAPFPSDGELAQRTIWVALLLVLGWTIVGLLGALPLYLVGTPCVGSYPRAAFNGRVSSLQDISLFRLLKMYDEGQMSTSTGLTRRAIVDGSDRTPAARARLIVLTVLLIVFFALPALFKLLHEWTNVLICRRQWLDSINSVDIVWLPKDRAPGFEGWGEGRVKDLFVRCGLTSRMGGEGIRPRNRSGSLGLAGNRSRSPGPGMSLSGSGRVGDTERSEGGDVDVHGVYTVVDTSRLKDLVRQRAIVLDNLEIAETHYIRSFQLVSSESGSEDEGPEGRRSGPRISRPRPLSAARKRDRRDQLGPGEHGGPTPTSYVAPSSYYKLRNVNRRAPSSWFSGTAVGTAPGTGTGTWTNSGPSKGASARESAVPSRTGRKGSDEYARQGTSDSHGVRGTSEGHGRSEDEHNRLERSIRQGSTGGRQSESRSHRQPVIRPISGLDHTGLALIYDGIREWRSELKGLNAAITEAQQEAFNAIAEGQHVKGWLIVGRNVRYLSGVQPIEGRAKADVRWRELQKQGGVWSDIMYWVMIAMVAVFLAVSLVPVVGLALAGAPDVAHFLPFLKRLSDRDDLGAALATTFVPAVLATLFISIALVIINYAARHTGAVSVSASRFRAFKATFYVLVFVATVWIIAVGALIFGLQAFDTSTARTSTVANGATYIAVLLMVIVLNAAVIAPGLLMLQPVRLWKVWKAQKQSITPRQYFRAIYPKSFNPVYASACCVLAVIFASTFSLIFPLIGPPILLLVLLSLVAYRYMVGYVWTRTNAPSTGGLLQLWLLRRFATLIALQPLLLGLIFLSRRLWGLAGVLLGAALLIVAIVEGYCSYRSRTPPERDFSPIVQESLATFKRSMHGSRAKRRLTIEEDGTSLVSSPMENNGIPRGSIASVLEMMSITLNVMASPNRARDAVPIETEDIDDLVSTERAAHTNPDAAPVIPSTDHAAETAGLLYPPELLAPAPMIWLPHDRSGVARNEAYDLGRYHDLETVIDPGDGYSYDGDSTKRRSYERTPTPRNN